MQREEILWVRASTHAESMAVVQSRKLLGKAGITPPELEAIRQDMLAAVWRALPRFDDERGKLEAFVTSVIINTGRMILRSRRQQKRGAGRPPISLDAENGVFAKARQIVDAPDRRLRESEVRAAVAKLPPHLADVAVMLGSKSIAQTSRLTGRTKPEVTADRDMIREHFRRCGFHKES